LLANLLTSSLQFDLEQYLSLFIRDEVVNWHIMHNKTGVSEQNIRSFVANIVDQVVRKAELMACRLEREQTMNGPASVGGQTNAVQSVVNLISTASNPQLLSRMSEQWLPWL
jgi:transformation/transcription domain-associated protein